MGTSVDTIKSWETRRRNPTSLVARILAAANHNPAFFSGDGLALIANTRPLLVTSCYSHVFDGGLDAIGGKLPGFSAAFDATTCDQNATRH